MPAQHWGALGRCPWLYMHTPRRAPRNTLAFVHLWACCMHPSIYPSKGLEAATYIQGKRSSIAEKSVSYLSFWCKLCFFSNQNFFQKKKEGDYLEETQEPPNNRHCLPEEVKHIAPTDIFGTSGTGKATELWREGWFYTHRLHTAERKKYCWSTPIRCSS